MVNIELLKSLNKEYQKMNNQKCFFEINDSEFRDLKINFEYAIGSNILTSEETEKLVVEYLKTKTSDIVLLAKDGLKLVESKLPETLQVVLKYIIKNYSEKMLKRISDSIIEFIVPKVFEFIELVKKFGKWIYNLGKSTVKKVLKWCKTKISEGYEAAKKFIKENQFIESSKKIFSKIINYLVKKYNEIKTRSLEEAGICENQYLKIPITWYGKDLCETYAKVIKELDKQHK